MDSLATSLEIVLRETPAALVDPQTRDAMRMLAGALPPPHRVGFERRLGTHARDEAMFWALSAAELRSLKPADAERVPELSVLGQPLSATLLCTRTPVDCDIWFEFDHYTPASSPSIFLTWNNGAPHSLPGVVGTAVTSVIAALGGEARVPDIGWMQRDDAAPVRVNVHLDNQAWVGAPVIAAPAHALFDDWIQHARVSGFAVVLAIDCDTNRSLDCTGIELRPDTGADWRHLLELCAQSGLARDAEVLGLLDWDGIIEPDAIANWPEALVEWDLVTPASAFPVLEKRLSHIKLAIDPEHQMIAKACFGYRPRLLKMTI